MFAQTIEFISIKVLKWVMASVAFVFFLKNLSIRGKQQ
jgi:hypothetical protein